MSKKNKINWSDIKSNLLKLSHGDLTKLISELYTLSAQMMMRSMKFLENKKWQMEKKKYPKNNSIIHILEFFRNKYFRGFFRRYGAQNRSVLDVREDSLKRSTIASTGSTTKRPKRHYFERTLFARFMSYLSLLITT